MPRYNETYLREYPNAIQDDLSVLTPSILILFLKKGVIYKAQVDSAAAQRKQSCLHRMPLFSTVKVPSSLGRYSQMTMFLPASFCKELGLTQVSASNLVLSCPSLSNCTFIRTSAFKKNSLIVNSCMCLQSNDFQNMCY